MYATANIVVPVLRQGLVSLSERRVGRRRLLGQHLLLLLMEDMRGAL